ncbi:sirohydrochlorin chelatase [Corynebacterium amycolatum]|uniref:sirohydrochlorin chelatase n=1 Tax=Corynebacterium amycolatum TaxID=43765 RepID=UPI00254CB525|nr:CbiX/SirB N-terminal domain-containing protein [Corynebacterium amycolatum]MDK7109572.1 CbiX/SirB N-terminal domain-containing protein [Corynebacterium amycolatum]
MTALILLAHGSRHPETKPVLEEVVALVREKMPLTRLDAPSQIRLAWLDLDEPSLDAVCADLAAAGETRALAVPLLFTDAFHSRVDVPEQVRLCDRHGVDITVAEGLGLGDGTKRAVVKRIIEAAENASFSWPVDALVMGVGSSDEEANAAVHQFAANLGGMLPGHVSAAFVVGPENIKGSDAVAVAQERAAKRGRGLVVVPLFTAPGLLWDRVLDAGAAAGAGQVAFGEPLAELLAPIVCCRWDSRAAYTDVQVVA